MPHARYLPSFAAAAIFLLIAVAPLAAQSVLEDLSQSGPYSEIADLFEETDGGEAALGQDRKLTLFAPTNEAFRRLPQDLRAVLSAPERDGARELLLGAHMVSGWHRQDDLPVEMETLGGQRLIVTYTDGALTLRIGAQEDAAEPDAIRDQRASAARIRATASDPLGSLIVHPIDRVLLPVGLESALEEDAATAQPPASTLDEGSLPEQLARTDEPTTMNVVPPSAPQQNTRPDPVGVDELKTPDAGIVVLTPEPAEDESGSAMPQAATTPSQPDPDTAEEEDVRDVSLTRPVTSVAGLIGRSVTSSQGTNLGRVTDLLMALDTGRVETLVIERETGFLGLGDAETLRVGLDALSIDPLQNRLTVDDSALEGDQGANE